MDFSPEDVIGRTVASARVGPGGRSLAIELQGGTGPAAVIYESVGAIAATLSARIGAASWLEDVLPGAELGDVCEGRGAPGSRLRWLVGDEDLFLALPVRDGLSFVGGRFFRVFVGALRRELVVRGPHGG